MEMSNHQKALNKDGKPSGGLITASQAIAEGFIFRTEPPESKVCQFCGKVLEPQGIPLGNKMFMWIPYHQRCTCKDAKAYWKEYDRRKQAEREDKKRQARQRVFNERVERLFGKSGIKKRFLQRTFESFRRNTEGRERSYRIAKEYAENWQKHFEKGEGLYIEGTNGTGKTHLAAAIAIDLLMKGVPVICKTSSDILQDIRKAYDCKDVSEETIVDMYKNVDLLVIDDLGKEPCTEWSVSMFYSIINDRYEDMKPTIITTNYGANQLIERMTPKGGDNSAVVAIISRLQETSMVMTMAWKDMRSSNEI